MTQNSNNVFGYVKSTIGGAILLPFFLVLFLAIMIFNSSQKNNKKIDEAIEKREKLVKESVIHSKKTLLKMQQIKSELNSLHAGYVDLGRNMEIVEIRLKLHNLYTEYIKLQIIADETDTEKQDSVVEQQKAIIGKMKREVTNIPASEVPKEIRKLIRK